MPMRYDESLNMHLSLVSLDTYVLLINISIIHIIYSKVGESFRYQYPRFVVPSYIIAGIYCTADAASDVYTVLSEDDKEANVNIINNRSKEVRAGKSELVLFY